MGRIIGLTFPDAVKKPSKEEKKREETPKKTRKTEG